MRRIFALCLSLCLALPTAAAVLDPYQYKGCRYEGDINAQNQPHGKGFWQCADGRSYKGQFKHGKFEGKGVYTVAVSQPVFLNPFNVNSTKLNHMELVGRFKDDKADGTFNVSQNGTLLFIMKFKKGMMQDVQMPKTAGK